MTTRKVGERKSSAENCTMHSDVKLEQGNFSLISDDIRSWHWLERLFEILNKRLGWQSRATWNGGKGGQRERKRSRRKKKTLKWPQDQTFNVILIYLFRMGCCHFISSTLFALKYLRSWISLVAQWLLFLVFLLVSFHFTNISIFSCVSSPREPVGWWWFFQTTLFEHTQGPVWRLFRPNMRKKTVYQVNSVVGH